MLTFLSIVVSFSTAAETVRGCAGSKFLPARLPLTKAGISATAKAAGT